MLISRKTIARTGKCSYGRPHYPTSFLGGVRIVGWFAWEFFSHLPDLLALRRFYQTRPRHTDDPVVAMLGDNLDEVNGIALNARSLVRTFRRSGRRVYLIGIAFHSKRPRMETEKGAIFMIPGRCSMDQPGYHSSEVAVPRLDLILRLLRRYPVDLFEFETPGAMALMGLLIARIVGIRTISHYRTDILTYSRLLIPNPLAVWAINSMVVLITRLAGRVVIPSEAYRNTIEAMGVRPELITRLPRGVDLTMFHPEKRNNGAWERLALPAPGLRLLYLGRISREKNLEMLVQVYRGLEQDIPGISLTVVGDGPFRAAMEESLRGCTAARFTGFLRGQDLAGVLAAGDLMVFPSATDTFGNTVVEALASGIPAVVSDEGGPQEIIEDGISGLVFRADDAADLEGKLRWLASSPDRLREMKAAARPRALQFTYPNSADKFWEFFQKVVRE